MVNIMENPMKIHDLGGKNPYFWVDTLISLKHSKRGKLRIQTVPLEKVMLNGMSSGNLRETGTVGIGSN